MSGPPSSKAADREGRLQRCIRDLSTLHALQSMCIGRSPDEVLATVLDALPTALNCELIYLKLSGVSEKGHASLDRAPATDAQLAELEAITSAEGDGVDALVVVGGRRFWCVEAEVPIGGERGRLLAGRCTPLDDETDRVLVRTAANIVGTTLENANVLEAARRKDEFLAVLGHELRNPLAPIVTAVERLARIPAAAREQKVIERHTRHLARLVDDLLDISRVTRGHVELRSEHVSLASVLERATEMAYPMVARQRHLLRVASNHSVILQGDPVRLAQVFGNLLTNAAKFTPPGGTIEVSIETLPGRVRVAVRDSGRGIAPDQLRRIFEPFVQVHREQDALQGGLGLGLAIVSNLVERHGGSITVQSEGVGRGAVFTVELPAAPGAERLQELTEPRAASARANVRVLIVDDNADIADLLSEALQDEGFQTAIAYDGHTALETWRRFIPHAAVLDVGLPDVDGYELAKMLRIEYGTQATLIAATGYGQPQDRQRSTEAGFDCHLVKPVSIGDLVLLLDQKTADAEPRSTPLD